jgi:hypothetical protein
MARGIEHKSNSLELNGLVQVRQDTPLLKFATKADGKVVERGRPMRMSKGTEC